MGESAGKQKILIISQPAYGDSIILKRILDDVCGENWEIDILTKECFKDFFLQCENVSNVICGDFPIWYNKRICLVDALNTWVKARKQQYDIVLDYIGDFRSRYIGYFCGGKKFITVERNDGHPFNNLIRKGLKSFANKVIFIPKEMVNIYEQIKFILEQIGFAFCGKNNKKNRYQKIIGIHPFASQACRCWSYEKWKVLVEKLLCNKKKICIFSSPQERKILEKQFGHLMSENVELFTGTLTQFMEKLKEIDLLIGLDSFSVHAAYAAGVPNVMICGANDYRMWQTPLTKVVAPKEECCQYWPCYNKPKCHGKYKCIESISVEDVLMVIGKGE